MILQNLDIWFSMSWNENKFSTKYNFYAPELLLEYLLQACLYSKVADKRGLMSCNWGWHPQWIDREASRGKKDRVSEAKRKKWSPFIYDS